MISSTYKSSRLDLNLYHRKPLWVAFWKIYEVLTRIKYTDWSPVIFSARPTVLTHLLLPNKLNENFITINKESSIVPILIKGTLI